jgi:hypothetical protein
MSVLCCQVKGFVTSYVGSFDIRFLLQKQLNYGFMPLGSSGM